MLRPSFDVVLYAKAHVFSSILTSSGLVVTLNFFQEMFAPLFLVDVDDDDGEVARLVVFIKGTFERTRRFESDVVATNSEKKRNE
jgi:hypothetical protein